MACRRRSISRRPFHVLGRTHRSCSTTDAHYWMATAARIPPCQCRTLHATGAQIVECKKHATSFVVPRHPLMAPSPHDTVIQCAQRQLRKRCHTRSAAHIRKASPRNSGVDDGDDTRGVFSGATAAATKTRSRDTSAARPAIFRFVTAQVKTPFRFADATTTTPQFSPLSVRPIQQAHPCKFNGFDPLLALAPARRRDGQRALGRHEAEHIMMCVAILPQ